MDDRACQRAGCGRSIPTRKRKDARWCSRSCESKARRAAARTARFEAANPGAAELLATEDQSVAELRDVADDDRQGDEAGMYAGDSYDDPWEARNAVWAAQQEFAAAIGRIRAGYEPLLRPYRDALRRNQGVKPAAMVKIEHARDAEIRELTREHQLAQAHEWAARDRPGRIACARERQDEQAAARAFAADLGRGRFLPAEPDPAGRDIHSTWRW